MLPMEMEATYSDRRTCRPLWNRCSKGIALVVFRHQEGPQCIDTNILVTALIL